jgi:hypothetical protein
MGIDLDALMTTPGFDLVPSWCPALVAWVNLGLCPMNNAFAIMIFILAFVF